MTFRAAQSHYLLGEAYSSQDRFAEAAAEYGVYTSVRSVCWTRTRRKLQADSYFSAMNYVEALNTDNAAASLTRLGDGTDLQVKIGQTRARPGDYAGALAQYDFIAQTGNDFVKAQMDYLSGSAYNFLGQTDKAHERFLHAVENYPVLVLRFSKPRRTCKGGCDRQRPRPRFGELFCRKSIGLWSDWIFTLPRPR